VFTVKDNQPGLVEAIGALAPDAFPPAYRTVARGHGRVEHRSLQTAPAPAMVSFPAARQVLVLTRHTNDLAGRALRTEVYYGITSLDAAQADPARRVALVRGQWTIENQLHRGRGTLPAWKTSQARCACGRRACCARRPPLSC